MLVGDGRDHDLLGHAMGRPQALPLRVRPQGPRARPSAPRARKTEQGQQMKSLCVGFEPKTFNANCRPKSLLNEKMRPIANRKSRRQLRAMAMMAARVAPHTQTHS